MTDAIPQNPSALFPAQLIQAAEQLLAQLRARRQMLACAESCTGGLLAGLITSISGASEVFDRGFVTYSNEAKQEALGVPQDLLAEHGAVSREVALAMAEGALRRSNSSFSVSITGVAGPGGGTLEKPVGLVYIGVGAPDGCFAEKFLFGDLGRENVRLATLEAAIALLGRHI